MSETTVAYQDQTKIVVGKSATGGALVGKPFAKGNPGKPKGTIDRHVKVERAIYQAICNRSGTLVKFIEQQLEENPLEVLKLLVKLQPKQTSVTGQIQQIVFNVAPIGVLPAKRIVAEQEPNSNAT